MHLLHNTEYLPDNAARYESFKPQRGKFTQYGYLRTCRSYRQVSNPNGVNLHWTYDKEQKGVVHSFKPQRGKFTLSSSVSPSAKT